MKMRNIALNGIAILIVILILFLAHIFYSKNCENETCFNSAMAKCNKAKYIKESDMATWQYNIKGKSNEECKIEVTLLMLKQGKTDIANWEGKKMECFLPLTYVGFPEEKLNRCHGRLKEEIQETIIKKNHNYILDNINQIAEEMKKPI